jgi:curved DNA-binding protein CbpA
VPEDDGEPRVREPLAQQLDEVRVEVDGDQLAAGRHAAQELAGDGAGAGAQLDDHPRPRGLAAGRRAHRHRRAARQDRGHLARAADEAAQEVEGAARSGGEGAGVRECRHRDAPAAGAAPCADACDLPTPAPAAPRRLAPAGVLRATMASVTMEEIEELPEEVLRLMRERVARGLDERPLRLDAAAHRERLAAQLARLGAATFYELLGIDIAASPEEVHAAYEEVARLVHPQHAERVGLERRQPTLELLFERATRAYLTLSLPERRKRYDAVMLPAGAEQRAAAAQRKREQHDMAREYYERAARLAETGDTHTAIELLELATQAERRPEYFRLLGDLQAKNPFWLGKAAESYRRAQQLGGKEDASLAAALANVEERLAAAAEQGEGEDDEEPPPPAPLKFAPGARKPAGAGR